MNRLISVFLGGLVVLASASSAWAQPFRLSGTVVQEGTSTSIPSAAVTLNGPGGARSATADAAGAFVFDGLATGDYNLTASATCFLSAQQAVTVAQDETVSIGLARDPDRYTVSGTVRLGNAADDPEGIAVVLEQAGGAVASASTDLLGRYQFRNVCTGTYDVVVTRSGYQSVRQEVVVSADTEAAEINLAQLGPFTVSGTIHVSGGGDPSGIVVRLEPGGLESAPSATDGTFRIEQVPFGEFTLSATKDGLEPVRVPRLAVAADVGLDLFFIPALPRRDEGVGCGQTGDPRVGLSLLLLVLGALLLTRRRATR